MNQYAIAVANVDSARGALAVTRKALADTLIRAPIAGLISSRNVQPGEKVSPDNRLLDVVDLSIMELEAAVPTSDIAKIRTGQNVQVKLKEYRHRSKLRYSVSTRRPAAALAQ
jgi:multidrug resistance efflux pump